MKKRDFLFAGLLLAAVPMTAQQVEVPEGPTRTDKDAKVIFEQGFEDEFDVWANTPVETIDTLFYFAHKGDSGVTNQNNWKDADWEIIPRTDSVLVLYNGVKQTDNAADEGAFDMDTYTILKDLEGSTRKAELEQFGIDPGKYYFQYVADHKLTNKGNAYTDGVVDNYRRNLFVRGLPIDDESSYRLTMFIKVNSTAVTTQPTFYADVMRGYFHSEKPFSTSASGHNEATFEYKQTEFTGNWEKVTFMTYYLNDSVQESLKQRQYWWSGDWSWWPEGVEKKRGEEYNYILQPDKYFVRLSFASDSTTFLVDNISLTKSWIGGVEYWGDKIRVDFGYETNLKTLANANYASTKIAAVELPAEYFTVLGHYTPASHGETGEPTWYTIPISSAEYHGDGYMYMFTEEDESGETYKFDYYDEVLVSFKNPVDDDKLCLKYTSSTLYPNGLDSMWIKDGKKVFDFNNEIATPNQYSFNKVYSMYNLPPVVQELSQEDGSFNLPATFNSLTIKFSRPVQIEEGATEQSESAMIQVIKSGKTEYWLASELSNGDSTVTFTRPAKYTTPLDGDYEFKLSYVQGKGTDFAEPRSFHYSFGTSDVAPVSLSNLDFLAETAGDAFVKNPSEINLSAFTTNNCAVKVGKFGGTWEQALMFGLYGVSLGNGNTFLAYTFNVGEEDLGTFNVQFGTSGCQKGSWNDGCKMVVTLADPSGATIGTYTEEGTDTKPEEGKAVNAIDENTITADFATPGAYTLKFALPNENSYGGGHKGGRVLYYIQITTPTLMGYPYIQKYRKALNALEGKINDASVNTKDYTGTTFEAAKSLDKKYLRFSDTKPSRYTAVTDSLNKAAAALQARFDLVDNMWKAYKDAIDKAAEYEAAAETDGIDYTSLAAYEELLTVINQYENYVCMTKTDDDIKAVQAEIENAGKALDNRKKLIVDFNNALDKAEGLLTDSLAQKSIPEYVALETLYNDLFNTNVIECNDETLANGTPALKNASLDYQNIVAIVPLATARMKNLRALAEEVGANEVLGAETAQSLSDLIDGAQAEDSMVVEAYKSAIKLAIYKKYQAAEGVDTIDLSSFIANAGLYVDVEINDVYPFIQVMDWNKGGNRNYAMIQRNITNETTFPGWSIKMGGGQLYPGGYVQKEKADYEAMPRYADSWVAFDWSTSFTMDQEVTSLPEGQYLLGSWFAFGNKPGKAFLNGYVGEDSYSLDVAGEGGGEGASSGPADHWIDSIKVADGQALKIEVKSAGTESWGYFDNFTLKLAAQKNANYAGYVEAAQKALDDVVTFVAEPAAAKNVEFYSIDGIKLNAPKSGIYFKVSKFNNGKRVVEKVLAE